MTAITRNNNRGIVVLIVLLILAMLTTVMVYLVEHEHIALRRGENIRIQQQMRQLALGAEQWAKLMLYRDAKAGNTDYLQEKWHQPLLPATVDNGKLSAVVEDLQARFNLNNLVTGQKSLWYPVYRRLLRILDINETLADSLVDWIDSDSQTLGIGGAEDLFYLSRTPSYRTANRYLADVGELLQISGYNRSIVDKLAPYVTTLPASTIKINVNTCDILLLQILTPVIMTESSAQTLIDARKLQGYPNINSFLTQPVLAGQTAAISQLITVSSHYFEAQSKVELAGIYYQLNSLLQRNNKVSVIRSYRSLL